MQHLLPEGKVKRKLKVSKNSSIRILSLLIRKLLQGGNTNNIRKIGEDHTS